MDTGLLRGFAGSARVGLLAGVGARVGVVLAAGSEARAVSPELVAGLEREVAAAGGGDAGRQVVVDRVAYTWFNRITALRFMDAAGITTMNVVSPVPGGVQPEVLTAAKQGVFEDAVSLKDRARVTGYLTGALVSPNPDRDAYGVLLAAYCRWWNQAMPFLFERTADYTELLIPQDLLADDSVRDKAVKTLTPEVCEDVEVIGWLYQFYISDRKDEVFAGFKKGKKAGPAEIPAATQLFTPHWIVRYLVENSLGRLWLLNHPDSGIRGLMEYYIDPVDEETDYLKISSPEEIKVIDPACGSGHMLTYAFDLLYAIYEEEGYPPSDIPTLILQNNLFGTEIDERAGTLAAFALTMKARLKQKTFLTRKVVPNIRVLRNVFFTPDELDFLITKDGDRHSEETFWNQFQHADTFGSLIQPDVDLTNRLSHHLETLGVEHDMLKANAIERADRVVRQAEFLVPRYSAVVGNPPYMGGKHMDSRLAAFAKDQFPDTKSDLFAMFIERCLEFLPRGGYSGLMTPFVWMFISAYASLRRRLIRSETITSLVQLEYSGFDGATVPICTFVLRRGWTNAASSFVRLSDFVGPSVQGRKTLEIIAADRAYRAGETASGMEKHLYRIRSSELSKLPGEPVAYWLSATLLAAFVKGGPLKDIATPRQGMATADNARFVRLWWEVSQSRSGYEFSNQEEASASGLKWFPYTDGGDFRRWYGNRWAVVNWEHNGKDLRSFERSVIRNPEYYFRPSVSWSAVGSGVPAFRSTPVGSIFSNAGMSFFAPPAQLEFTCAVCNSTTAERLFSAIAPTLNLGVGEIGRLPIVAMNPEVRSGVDALVARARQDWDDFETSWDFAAPSWLSERAEEGGSLRQHLEPWAVQQAEATREQQLRESANNRLVAEAYALQDEVPTDVPLHRVSLMRNVQFTYGPGMAPEEYTALERADVVRELVSYAVACMFGRYGLGRPGLVLADQGDSFETFLERVPDARFLPDRDNVIPIVDGDWFEDDIVARFREWLNVAFGGEHLQENWQYIEETLGKSVRQYFVKDFYTDHVKRYKKRPIYWLFSSPKGTFNALIYLHRYTPSTAGTVLHDYVLPFLTKLETELGQQEHLTVTADTPRAKAAATKQAEALRKQIVEVRDWATNTLQPLADKQLTIDLDDGVKHNYPLLGHALKKIPGLDTPNE